LLTTYYQADRSYRVCVSRQLIGVGVSALAVPIGWHLDGIVGIAVGALLGSLTTATLLLRECRNRWPGSVAIRPVALAAAALFASVLLLLRAHAVGWLLVAGALICIRAYQIFVKRPAPAAEPADIGRRLNILHLGFEDHRRPGSGGGSARNREINRRLSLRHNITVLTSNYPGARARTEDGVRYRQIGLSIGRAPSLLSYLFLLPFAARRYRADLVVEDFAPPFSSMLMPLWSRRPTLALVQWLNAKGKSREYHLPLAPFERLGVRSYRRLVTVSEDMRARLNATNPAAHVDVVPNGVDRLAFGVAQTCGADVVYLGRLETHQKGLDLLLEAFALVADAIDARLVLAGDGPGQRDLERRAADLGIAARVHFAGRVAGQEKYRLLAGARLVAMPSRFETFGMVAIEALASGTPVLAFDIPGLREVVPPQCGCLVASFDVMRYAQTLQQMYTDPQRLREMGRAGRVFAERFDWDTIAAAQEAVYLAAIDAATGQRRTTNYRPRHRGVA
jgi:glycosyltransferase involved in cell wall biosynthesis